MRAEINYSLSIYIFVYSLIFSIQNLFKEVKLNKQIEKKRKKSFWLYDPLISIVLCHNNHQYDDITC